MAKRGGQQYIVALVLSSAIYISLLGTHAQALQLVRNGIPYRARDEVQFLAPNISLEAPEGLEIDRNAPPTRVEVPIDVEIEKQEDMAGKIASKTNLSMQQMLAAKNVTSNATTTTTIAPKVVKATLTNSTVAPSTPTKATTSDKKTTRGKSDIEKGPKSSGSRASHSTILVVLSTSLAICVANKMFFI